MRLHPFVMLLVAMAAVPVHAGVIFNTFGPGDAYQTGTGWTLGYPGTGFSQGDAFTPVSTATLGSVELAVGLVSGPNDLLVWLMSDSSGQPGSVIESWSFSGAMGDFGYYNPPLVGNSALHPLLSGGTQYWLIAGTPTDQTWAAWNFNSIGHTGPHASRTGSGSWGTDDDTTGAFRISSYESAIPEPGTWCLVLAGIALLGARRLIRAR